MPLIDVLVMLIFFAFVTMQFKSASTLNITLPKVETAGKNEFRGNVTVTIDKDGTLTFNADLSYTLSESVTPVVNWNFPYTCVAGITCAEFGVMLEESFGPTETFTCTGASDCTCTEAGITNENNSGSYEITGTNVVHTSAAGNGTSTNGYCVQGSTFHLMKLDATATNGIRVAAVAVKQ